MKHISPDTGVIFDNPARVRDATLSVVRELYPPTDSVHFRQEDGSWSRCDLDVTRWNPCRGTKSEVSRVKNCSSLGLTFRLDGGCQELNNLAQQ